MRLNHKMPRCTPTLRDRIERCLEPAQCVGYKCDGGFAAMRRRFVGGNETLHVQCTTCGRSISGSVPKRECFEFSSLEQWDDALVEAWRAKEAAEWRAQMHAHQAKIEYLETTRETRRVRYANWLRTSPEWRSVRARVMRRANFVCECCLEAEARDVHHETYELGVLPPAWLLRAVCRTCHQSLHNFEPVTV